MTGIDIDVTERRALEDELRQLTVTLEARVREEVAAREAAQARAAQAERMQALGQLAGGIAHDLNNVLQAAAGAFTLIQRKPNDEAAVRRFAQLGAEAIDRGASITGRLLTFGRRGGLRAEALDVATLLRGVHEMLSHTLGAGIDVAVTLPEHLPPAFADKGQLETALINLATNARDAMPQGGRLTFSASAETIDRSFKGLTGGPYVRLEIADTGTGMDAATLARAREPFFTTKQSGAGTGLGLPMAIGFVEQSDGAISIDSQLGAGTVVTIWLPQGSVEPARASAPRTAAAGMRAQVLLVDDEQMVREVLARYLTDAGYTVRTAASGAEVLVLLDAGEATDILLTDLSMAGMNGLAVIRAVQERFPGVPAILLTGYADASAEQALTNSVSGTVSLLRKPISDVQLLDRVSAMLAARAAAA
jgi:signal transduction histidine kinase/ActR/RegA family two-component response regulator